MTTLQAASGASDIRRSDDQAWEAWKAKGKAHDRLVHGRLRLAWMIGAGVACAVVAAVLLG